MRRLLGVSFFIVALFILATPFFVHAQFPVFQQGGLVPCGNNVHVTTDEVDEAGNRYLCIYDECTTCGLVTLAKNLIDIAVFLAVCVAALLFMYAGALYLFSSSSPGNISKAHRIFWDVLLGLVAVLAAWMVIDVVMKVLYGDGPQGWGPWNAILCEVESERDCRIVEVKRAPATVGTPPVPVLPPPGGGGGPKPGDRGCPAPSSGPCSIASLGAFGGNAYMAAGICMQESSGRIDNHGDRCQDGSYASWGLFQINISANPLPGLNCPAAFTVPAKSTTLIKPGLYSCTVKNTPEAAELYRKCVEAASTPSINIAKALEMSRGGAHWISWGTNKICKFPN